MRLYLHLIMFVVAMGVLAANGATPSTTPGGTGLFGASENSPDTCSVTGNVEVRQDRCKVESAEQPADYGEVVLDSVSGASATFKGRVQGWGAHYKTGGIFTGGGTGGTASPAYWDAWFKDTNELRLRIEVKEPSHEDDWIPYGADSGGTLSVTLAGSGSGTFNITIADQASSPKVQISPGTLSLSPGGTSSCTLKGIALGSTTLRATAAGVQPGSDGVEVLPKVTFGQATVKTGFTTDNSKDIFKVVTANVDPKSAVNQVDLAVGGQNRISISDVQKDANAGTITAKIRGTSATPANKPNGDTKILAKKGAREIASMDAVVIVPAAIGLPHPNAKKGSVTPVNILANATSFPCDPSVPEGSSARYTAFMQLLTVKVVDQFSNALDPMYEGVPVTESGNKINQSMTSAGTYTDPVGMLISANPLVVPNASTEARNWPTDPTLTPPREWFKNQSRAVEVGGHSLNPAVKDRVINFETPNILEIWW